MGKGYEWNLLLLQLHGSGTTGTTTVLLYSHSKKAQVATSIRIKGGNVVFA